MPEALSMPSPVSFRHARSGVLGIDGLLPIGWVGESVSMLSVETVRSEAPPSIELRLEFGPDIPGDYVALSVGPYVRCNPSGLFVLRADIAFESADNIALAILVIREWVENGPFVDQTIHAVDIEPDYVAGQVGRTSSDVRHVFQPVLTFRRKSRGAGAAKFRLRSIQFADLYEYPGWLRATQPEISGR